jgi:arsenite methyltransferase
MRTLAEARARPPGRRTRRDRGRVGAPAAATELERLLNVGCDPDTHSAMIAPFIGQFVPGRAGVTDADARSWLDDVASPADTAFFSLNRYVFLATKPVGPT